LTDMLNLYGQLLNECITGRNLFACLLVREHHFIESIAEHGTTFFKVLAFGDNFRPLHQLSHIP